jgi:hypothetical protein
MRDVYQVLKEKERAIERVRREIEALRLVSHLLADEEDLESNVSASGTGTDGRAGIVSQERKAVYRKPSAFAGRQLNGLAKTQARAGEAEEKGTRPQSPRNILLQFRRRAVDGSRTLFRRVLNSSLLEYELRRKGLRDLLERLARSPAA